MFLFLVLEKVNVLEELCGFLLAEDYLF